MSKEEKGLDSGMHQRKYILRIQTNRRFSGVREETMQFKSTSQSFFKGDKGTFPRDEIMHSKVLWGN
jgi:hypothetical protein